MPRIKFEDYKEACNNVMDMAEETVKEQYNGGVATDLCGSLICEKYGICQGGFQRSRRLNLDTHYVPTGN